jgi:hypothetical protein
MSRQRSAFTNPIITTSEKKSIHITITRHTPKYCKYEASECPHPIPRRLNYIQHLRTTTSSPSQSTSMLAVLDACTSYHSALPSVPPSPLLRAIHPPSNLVLLLRVRKRGIRIPSCRAARGGLARGASGARRYVTLASSLTQHDFQKLTRTRALRTGVSSIGSRRRIRRAGTYVSISVSVSISVPVRDRGFYYQHPLHDNAGVGTYQLAQRRWAATVCLAWRECWLRRFRRCRCRAWGACLELGR